MRFVILLMNERDDDDDDDVHVSVTALQMLADAVQTNRDSQGCFLAVQPCGDALELMDKVGPNLRCF